MNGFIVIHRKILKWGWYQDTNTFRVFIHCLLMANYEDNEFKGRIIKRGSFVTSLKQFSRQTKLTVKQVRTALEHLKSTNEIAVNATNRYSIITVNNYNLYQDYDKQEGIQGANRGQTNGKQRATTNNITNKQINNKTNNNKCIDEQYIVEQVISYLNEKTKKNFKSTTKSTQRHINARIHEGFILEDFKRVIDKKTEEWLDNEKMNAYLRPETLFGTKFESYLFARTKSEIETEKEEREAKEEEEFLKELQERRNGT